MFRSKRTPDPDEYRGQRVILALRRCVADLNGLVVDVTLLVASLGFLLEAVHVAHA